MSAVTTVNVNGLGLYYEETGSGEPVLLIPGFISNTITFEPQIPALAEGHRVIAIDNRDAGRSSAASARYTIADMADDAAGVLDALGAAPAHVFGQSMGGMIAQEMALRHPEKVRSLVLACTTCGGPRSAGWDELQVRLDVARQLREMPSMDSDLVRRQLDWLFTPEFLANPTEAFQQFAISTLQHPSPIDGVRRQANAIAGHDTYDRLPEIRVPTLVISGDSDPLILPENSRILAGRIPGARLVLLPNLRHGFTAEAPDLVNAAVLSFLTGARTLTLT